MTRNLQDALARWLASEAAGSGETEEAMSQVFEALPQPAPSAGFLDRVLTRTRLIAPPVSPALSPRSLRIAALATLVLVAATPALVLVMFEELVPRLPLAGVVTGAGWLTAGLVNVLAAALAFADLVADVGGALVAALATPEAMILFAIGTLLGAAALRLLYGLTAQDRSLTYVEPQHL